MSDWLTTTLRSGRDQRSLSSLLGEKPRGDEPVSRAERLNALLAEEEGAKRAGNAEALAFVDHKIESLLSETREAARQEAQSTAGLGGDQVSNVEHPGFDGGVRGRRGSVAQPPGERRQATANDLLRQAMVRSREERAARGDDDGFTITITNP